MRWSLILSTFIAVPSIQPLLSFALVTTQNEVTLENRAAVKNDVKEHSRTYRINALAHGNVYHFDGSHGVRVQSVPKDQRQGFFSKMFKGKKYDADHIFEAQTYHDTLRQQGTSHDQLPPGLQEEAKHIMNRPENVVPIPPSINRSKGQVIRWGLRGKSLRNSNRLARDYTFKSYPTARKTAKDLQRIFKKYGHAQQGPSFHENLRHSLINAGILTPGQPSPPSSPRRSQTF